MLHPLPPREPHLSKESTPFPNCVTRWESSVQMCESIGNIHTQTGTATLQDAVPKAHGGNWLNSTALPPSLSHTPSFPASRPWNRKETGFRETLHSPSISREPKPSRSLTRASERV